MRGVIREIVQESADVRRFRIVGDAPLRHRPGQFVMLGIPGLDLSRPYSVASSPTEQEYFELLIRHVEGGRFTTPLFEKRVGDEVEVRGPFGTFYFREGTFAPVVLIGGGTGLAPLRAMVQYLVAKGIHLPVRLFWV
ncbi:MAG: hypothetical protein HC945_01785 [Nitrosarchaeum sp.]|nr:hypothetical protein [Nitrosarchaeum sp.]